MKFSFETNHAAVQRLQKIAEVFNPFSLNFLREHVRHLSGPVLDLGCGAGYSTRMLSLATRSGEVYGMDRSEDRIAAAMDMFRDHIFVRHDLTKTPLPVNAEAMYSRFILGHLPDPIRRVNQWTEELPAGGKLLIEEMEGIETDVTAFRKYIAADRWLMASRNVNLFAGEELAGGTYDRAAVLVNESVALPVSNREAAIMFYLNIKNVWQKKGIAEGMLSPEEVRQISGRLQEIIDVQDERTDIVWNMRRMVLQKAA